MNKYSSFITCVFFSFLLGLQTVQAREEEKTYSISLTKTAEIQQDIQEIRDKKVLTQEITVQKGDYLWKILREKGLLKKLGQYDLLKILKQLNQSFDNLDLVHPGDKILIPLKISPITSPAARSMKVPEEKLPLALLKDVNFNNYTVKPGDNLIKVIKGRYDIPKKDLHNEYLTLVKKLNPAIKNLNTILPGQIVRLPIYSPEIVRKPIETAALKKPEEKTKAEDVPKKVSPVARDLGLIFMDMGEEWIQTGQHFIPLKSGGEVDLKAESFPIINLKNGMRVLVDLHNELPEKMADLIETSWSNYRIVHLGENDGLRASLDKVLNACNYPQILKADQALEIKGDVSIRVTGDWIIEGTNTGSEDQPKNFVITLKKAGEAYTPGRVKAYLERQGVKIIEYPPTEDTIPEEVITEDAISSVDGAAALLDRLLKLTQHIYSTNLEIPAYQSHKADLRLIIKADFFVKINSKDAIIDLTGLAPDIMTFLEEHQFMTLSLGDVKDPLALVTKTLQFLGVSFEPGPQSFKTMPEDGPGNTVCTMSGIVFSNPQGQSYLVTPHILPEEIAGFLVSKGYKILFTSFS